MVSSKTGLLAAGAAASLASHSGVSAVFPTDTYQQTCELPTFEWAAYGTRLTGRMYTRRAALLGSKIYAAGYLKSTSAPDKEGYVATDKDFGVTGPFTKDNPTGTGEKGAISVTSDLIDYTTQYGSFAQYEVGVVKIDALTGVPEDVYVYYGKGQDETSGLAAREVTDGSGVLAVSGHFVGSLSADHSDGTTTTINNSNAEGTADYVLHPNAVLNGFDDGFVILADAETGDARWIIAHPTSTKDAETVGVDLDDEGNVYGAGYRCNEFPNTNETTVAETPMIVRCDGFVAKFAAADGAIVWEETFDELAAAMWIAYDAEDGALYVTGTTTYKGEAKDGKVHPECGHETCAVTMRMSATDGTVEWVRTVQGSPRWNFFDQSGDVRLASASDGPYVYVSLDDAGENGPTTLDAGTHYSGCLAADGTLTPEFQIDTTKTVTAEDCPEGSTFVSRDADGAFPVADAATGAMCGNGHEEVDACVMKYHKYTGLPVWGTDILPVASIVPAPDGKSIMVTGYYWNTGSMFDSVQLPDYNGIEGAYNARLNAETGRGEYVMHSGGAGKTRPYDSVTDADGNIYMVGYTQSSVIHWGGTLKTKIIEEGFDQNDDAGTAFQMGKVATNSGEYQFFAVKLNPAMEAPYCVSSCDLVGGTVANSVVMDGHCLIDNVCYEEGEVAEIFGRSCQACLPEKSQTEWSHGSVVGDEVCFIGSVCYDTNDPKTLRESRSVTHKSACQACLPASNAFDWSIKDTYTLTGEELPNDCAGGPVVTVGPTGSPTAMVTTNLPTSAPSPIIKPAGNGPIPAAPTVVQPPTFPTPTERVPAPTTLAPPTDDDSGATVLSAIGGLAAAAAIGAIL